MIFSEGSGLNDSLFGKSQAPIRALLEKRGESFEQESAIKSLFNMQKSNKYAEKLTTLTAMNGFEAVGENGAYPVDEMQEGFSKTIEHMTWKDSFSISQEMVEDSTILNLRSRPEQFVAGYYRTRERFAAAMFGKATGGNTKMTFAGKSFDLATADGKALFAADHPAKVRGGAQSNKYSNEFSADALGMVETAMHQYKGDNGEVLNVSPDTIVISNDHALKKAVFSAIGADKDPATPNNGFNYQFGRWNVIIWPYLNEFIASNKAWILLDSQYNTYYNGAVWFDRVELSIRSEMDGNTDANIWKGRARWGAGFNDWRFAAVGGITGGTALS